MSILIRFRMYRVVLSAEIEKIFRQILVIPHQRSLQRIFFEGDHSKTHRDLNTMTYDTASAPYLATRVLRQIGLDNNASHPTVSEAIIHDFYMDDLLAGADTVEEAIVIKRDLQALLQAADLNLRKWASNEPSVVRSAG